MNDKFDKYFMDIALRTAELSTCKRLKVGAIAVKDNKIVSIGYNGSLPGHDNCCEERVYMGNAGVWLDVNDTTQEFPFQDDEGNYYKLKTKQEIIHAEENLIAKLANSNESAKDCIVYITHSPCLQCSKTLAISGIATVYYNKDYRNDAGKQFLRDAGIVIKQL